MSAAKMSADALGVLEALERLAAGGRIDVARLVERRVALMMEDDDQRADLVAEQDYRIVGGHVWLESEVITDTALSLWTEYLIRDVLPEVQVEMEDMGLIATEIWMPDAFRLDVTFVDEYEDSVDYTVKLEVEDGDDE